MSSHTGTHQRRNLIWRRRSIRLIAIYNHRRNGRCQISLPKEHLRRKRIPEPLAVRDILHSAIIEGLHETYYLCDSDLSKNADVHVSIIGHSLQKAKSSFRARGKSFPHHLRLHTDNTAAEGKNQTVMPGFAIASCLTVLS